MRRLRSPAALLALVLLVSGAFASLLPGDVSSSDTGTIRLVMSSHAPGERALSLSTRSLYAPNDRWKRYLASDDVCPGGERTDLSPSRQLSVAACLVNFARMRQGLRALPLASPLSNGSARKADAIARCGRFAHDPCGGDWTLAVRSTGYPGAFGENLYVASGKWAAPRVAVDAWLNSVAHRQNLFGPGWREQGFALRKVEQLGWSRDAVVWVNVLGSR